MKLQTLVVFGYLLLSVMLWSIAVLLVAGLF